MKFLALLLFVVSLACAQSVTGVVTNSEGEPLVGATVHIQGTDKGAYTDVEGKFLLKEIVDSSQIKVSLAGFIPVTRTVKPEMKITLQALQTDVVIVTGTPTPIRLADSPMKVEIISHEQLENSGSSNLMEALFSVNGLTEGVNCGVCGSNDIHINGLDGSASLFMIDGMPIMGNLASVYGLNGLPVGLVERVEIIKGPASTLYGTEAIGGVVNVITKSAYTAPKLSVNSWGNTQGEWNTDLSLARKLGKRSSLMFATNGYLMNQRIDQNNDTFTDVPLNKRVTLYSKWEMKRKLPLALAARYYYEDRFGGVMNWNDQDRGSSKVYGESILTERLELLGRYGISKHWQVDMSFAWHNQDSYYGNAFFLAEQQTGFMNLLHFQQIVDHKLTVGFSSKYQLYEDNTPATPSAAIRYIPGVFVEDNWKINPKWDLQAGCRLDYHREHGVVPAPRANLKWQPTSMSTFRLNSGTGFRLVNVFTEDHAALSGSRELVFAEQLNPERSVSSSLNYTGHLSVGKGILTVSGDAFYTLYTNRLIPDYSTEGLIRYENLDAEAVTRGFGLTITWLPLPAFTLMVGSTILDTYENVSGSGSAPILFAPDYTANWTLTWKHTKLGLQLDWQGKLLGPMQLPEYEAPFDRPAKSEVYSMQSLQLQKKFKKSFSVFVGARNLLNWTQPTPLIDPANPFGDNFDTAYAYGPVQGRRYYIGVNIELK